MRERPLTHRLFLHHMVSRKKARLRILDSRHAHMGDLASGKHSEASSAILSRPRGSAKTGAVQIGRPRKRKGYVARIVVDANRF
jgi:hypothetical protein